MNEAQAGAAAAAQPRTHAQKWDQSPEPSHACGGHPRHEAFNTHQKKNCFCRWWLALPLAREGLGHKVARRFLLSREELGHEKRKRPAIPFVQWQQETVQRTPGWDWIFTCMVAEMRASGCSILSI